MKSTSIDSFGLFVGCYRRRKIFLAFNGTH